jgi:hypothetical protein
MAPSDARGNHEDTEHDEQLMRPDGQRYQAPESEEQRNSKSWAYAALGLLVLLLLVLMATGAVPIFPR